MLLPLFSASLHRTVYQTLVTLCRVSSKLMAYVNNTPDKTNVSSLWLRLQGTRI